MEFEVSAELVAIYLEDAREQLRVLDDVLLRAEKEGPRPELMASVLGPLHTLKGNSGMIGLGEVKDFVHRLEEVFARGRDGALSLDREGLDQLFEAATALRRAIETSCAQDGEPAPLGPALQSLAGSLDLLSLGEETARSLGVRPGRLQVVIALGTGLAVGSAVAASGAKPPIADPGTKTTLRPQSPHVPQDVR